MNVKLIDDKEPWGLRIGGDGVGDMPLKVFFSAAWADCGCHDDPRRHLEVRNQALRPMAKVCIFGPRDQAWFHRQGRSGPLQCLYPGLLIRTDDVLPLLGDRWRVLVHRTD